MKSKILPFLPNYEIFDNGDVINLTTGEYKSWHLIKPTKYVSGKKKNIRNGYKRSRFKMTNVGKVSLSQHRLLAMAFIDCPGDFSDFIVNHKDGDGGNNTLNNLEWTTYAGNTKHAYDTGLSQNVRGVTSRDATTGEIESFKSIQDCADAHNETHGRISFWVSHKAGLITGNGRAYRYSNDTTEWSEVRFDRRIRRSMAAYNVHTKDVHIAADTTTLSYITGLIPSNIANALKRGITAPIGDWVYQWYTAEHFDIPVFSIEQLELFKLARPKSDVPGYKMTKVATGESEVLLLKDIALKLGISYGRSQRVVALGTTVDKQWRFVKIDPNPGSPL